MLLIKYRYVDMIEIYDDPNVGFEIHPSHPSSSTQCTPPLSPVNVLRTYFLLATQQILTFLYADVALQESVAARAIKTCYRMSKLLTRIMSKSYCRVVILLNGRWKYSSLLTSQKI